MSIFGKQLTISPRPFAVLQNAGPVTRSRGEINLDNILKLIPGDVVALFISGNGLAQVAGNQPGANGETLVPENWSLIVFLTCLAICAIVRIFATRPESETGFSIRGVNWSLVIVSLIAFFVWTHAVSSTGPVFPAFHGPLAGFFAMALGIVAPLFVKAD